MSPDTKWRCEAEGCGWTGRHSDDHYEESGHANFVSLTGNLALDYADSAEFDADEE